MALLIEGRYLVAQFKLFVIGQQDQDAEGNRFAMEMAFDDLRQDRRRVIEHVSQGRIVVVVAAARRTVGNEARADDDIQDDLLQGIGDLLGLEIFQGLFTILQERRRAGFADGPAQEDRMEVFRRTAGQFRFTFFTHSIADAGPEELERRVGNDGHIDEGMDRRLVEIVVAGKGFIGFVHDSQGRRWSTVGSQRRESEQGLASPVITGPVLPYIFITIACGAVSGFHCMISTGTTPKMLMNERSILPVGYGAMLTESFVGMMALIAACSLVPNDYFAINSSAEHFQALGIQVVDLPQLNAMVGENVAHRPGGAVSLAVGMAFIFSNIPGLDHLMNYWYHFCIMFEALFIMTIIDAGTRVGRYMLQELVGRVWPKFGDPHWLPGAIIASALISGAWGYIVLQGNLSTIWPIFGVSNQLLAIITLAISTVVICAMGKARFAWVTIIPWAFLTVVIFWADYLNMFNIYLPKQEWLLFTVSAIMALLVIIVSISSIRRCLYLAKTVPPSYDTTETVEAEELKHLEELIKTDPVAKRFKELTVDHH